MCMYYGQYSRTDTKHFSGNICCERGHYSFRRDFGRNIGRDIRYYYGISDRSGDYCSRDDYGE